MAKDLTGHVFGRLTVVGLSEISRNGHKRYHCICECGAEKTVFGSHLIQGNSKSCGCLRYEPRNFQGCGGVSLTYYSSLKRGAEGGKGRSPMTFDVTIEYLAKILESQGNICVLSGLPISYRDKTASLDRIDSSEGYVGGNVQWVHKDVNMMKRHYSQSYFIDLCSKVSSHAHNNKTSDEFI